MSSVLIKTLSLVGAFIPAAERQAGRLSAIRNLDSIRKVNAGARPADDLLTGILATHDQAYRLMLADSTRTALTRAGKNPDTDEAYRSVLHLSGKAAFDTLVAGPK